MNVDLLDRMIAKTEFRDDGCFLWTGAHDEKGYGMVRLPQGPVRRVHRVAFELLVEPITDGLTLDHLCMVKKGSRSCMICRRMHSLAATRRRQAQRGN